MREHDDRNALTKKYPYAYSLTCKRRHLKCDESYPECGPCVKSKQSCLYATRAPQSPSRSLSSGDAPSQGDAPRLHMPLPIAALSRNEATEPAAPSIFMSIPNVPPDIPNQSVCPAPTPPDAAFYRWFGLLADDAIAADQSAGVSRLQETLSNSGTAESLGPHGLINGLTLETFRQRYAIPSDVAQCLSRAPSPGTVSRDSWLESKPTELSDYERKLFHNFVTEVSLWVSYPCSCARIYSFLLCSLPYLQHTS